MYIENPKTKGSGIICCIPQDKRCPFNCPECFFQNGRSYLEPLDENLPNMPTLEQVGHRVVRVNDGNDSSVYIEKVIEACKQYPLKFYNTSVVSSLALFDAPVVFTVNSGESVDKYAVFLKDIPKNLMFVRFLTNTWNQDLCNKVIDYYTDREIPVVLTFMAYHNEESIPESYRLDYILRKRTSNNYFAIKTDVWANFMDQYKYNSYVYSCGKVEGELGTTKCARCGNCLREFFAALERTKL